MKKEIIRYSCLCFVLVCVVFASCASVPRTTDPVLEESSFIPLEPGAQVYVFADVTEARSILDLIPIAELSQKRSKQMLDRTSTAVAALYPPESGRRFHLTAWGNYPTFQAGLAFGFDKNWKKNRSAAGNVPFWYSAKDRLSIALNAKQVFVAAAANNVKPEPFAASPGIEVPEGFSEFRRGSILSCWLENPGPMLNRVMAAMQIPLQIPADRIFISLFPAAGQDTSDLQSAEKNTAEKKTVETERQYEALLRLQVESPTQARALATFFVLAKGFLPDTAPPAGGPAVLMAVLFANPPVQDGQNLNIKTAALTEKEIALLLNVFSVYSQ